MKIWLDDINGVVYNKDATEIFMVPNGIKTSQFPIA